MQNRIRELRQERGWTMEHLAETAGTSPQQIGKLERGERRLTLDWMERLARALNRKPAELLPEGGERMTGVAEPDVARYDGAGDPGYEQRLLGTLYPGRSHAMVYQVHGRALDVLGYMPGDLLIVDFGAPAIAGAKAGDVVVAQVADRESGEAETVLRLYQPPLLVTQSTDPALRRFDHEGEHAAIMGVVKHLVRTTE